MSARGGTAAREGARTRGHDDQQPATPSTWRAVPHDPERWFGAEELRRARAYQGPLARVRAANTAVSVAVLVAFVVGHAGPRLLDTLELAGWALEVVAVTAAVQLAGLVHEPWFAGWTELVHDRRWGLSSQTTGGWLADQAKSFVLGTVLNALVLLPVYALIRSVDHWWLPAWAFVVGFSVLFGFLYPVVVAPVFNRFSPLADDELRDRLFGVASRAGVQVREVLVADASRRTRRDNAYFAGLGRTRRIVIFDNLLEHDPEVVEQVVAHEVGHWRRGHLRRQLPLVAGLYLAVFVALWALGRWEPLLEWAGVERLGDPGSVPLLLLGLGGFSAVTSLATSWLSRVFERQADVEALELLGRPDRLVAMLRALSVRNLADLAPSAWRRLTATHPPAAERMELAARWGRARGIAVEPGTPEG